MTAAVGDRRVTRLASFTGPGLESGGGGLPIVDEDGTGPVYADYPWTEVMNAAECWDMDNDMPTASCRYRLRGHVWRVVGRARRRVPRIGPAFAVAATPSRVAYVPGSTAETTGTPAGPERRIVVRRLRDGAPVGEIAVDDEVKALAFSGSIVAVLVQDATGEARIERYEVAMGQLIGATVVPNAPSVLHDIRSSLDVGHRVVYRIRNAIHVLAVRDGDDSVVWRTRRPPLDLAIEGRRIVWGTNGGGNGRILSLVLR